MDDGAYSSFRASVPVLERRVQGTAERARIYTLSVMMHTFYYRTLPASRVLLYWNNTNVSYTTVHRLANNLSLNRDEMKTLDCRATVLLDKPWQLSEF